LDSFGSPTGSEDNMADSKKKLESKAKRLAKQEYIIWLTTVDSIGMPQPRPVWLIWDKD